jgi:excisionase family DNA binding protein
MIAELSGERRMAQAVDGARRGSESAALSPVAAKRSTSRNDHDSSIARACAREGRAVPTERKTAVPKSWVLESARSGAIPCVRLGRYVRFDLDDVEHWLEQCKQPGRAIALRTTNPRR